MLRKKTLRDIKYNKSQFFTIFLMVFLGVFVFAGVHAYMDGMQVSADNYYEKNNLQDLWLSGLNFSKDDLKQVKELDNIKDAERALTLTTTLDNYDDITIEANFIESNNISKMYYKVLQSLTRVEIQKDTGDFRLLDRRCVNALKQLRETQRCSKSMFHLFLIFFLHIHHHIPLPNILLILELALVDLVNLHL